jgi:hypothetical protein
MTKFVLKVLALAIDGLCGGPDPLSAKHEAQRKSEEAA